jgi:hypothetical protein
MFRTRDFVLLFGMIVFLLVAIGTTLLKQNFLTQGQTSMVQLAETSDREYEAVIAETTGLDRDANVTSLRRKISENGGLAITEFVVEETIDEQAEDVSIPGEQITNVGSQNCSNYVTYTKNWSPQNIQFEIAEGARVVYRVVESVVGTSTIKTKETLLQLPVGLVAGAPTCLASDVIGIAQDGSLIRNDEVALYGVFGESTLIGYALDGFPIYGTSEIATDSCGGTVVGGAYRYYLADDREVVLNCFSAVPISL